MAHRALAACACLLLLAGAHALRADVVTISPLEGIVVEPGHDLRFDLQGRFAGDYVEYDQRNARHDQFRVDRAMLGLDGSWREQLEGRAFFDLSGIDTRYGVFEAWLSYAPARFARVTAGLQPIALGVEGSWPEAARPLAGMPGFATFLTSRTDVALRLDGEIADGIFSYDLAAAAGEGGFDLFGQRRGDPQLSAAVTTYPFRPLDWTLSLGPYRFPLVSGLFGRAGYAWTPDFDGRMDVATPLRNKLFLTSRLDADRSSAWHVGYGIDFGPIRAVHEFARVSLYGVRTPAGFQEDVEEITAWQVLVAWRITGEPYDSRPYGARDWPRPTPPDRPLGGHGSRRGPGAFELAFRYANGDIDRDFFRFGFTDTDTSSQEFRVAAVALNWDAAATLRFSAEIARTIADQNPAVFDSHGRDTSGLIRVEVNF